MDFTQAEKERINQLYGTDFQDITPDDALLIGRWEAWKAVNESEHQAKLDAIKAESEQKLEQSQAQYELAMQNLEELHTLALERYKGL